MFYSSVLKDHNRDRTAIERHVLLYKMENYQQIFDQFPSPYHFCAYARKVLLDAGFTEMDESKVFPDGIKKGFIIRRGRALVAFDVREMDKIILASATDDFTGFKVQYIKDIEQVGQKMITLTPYGRSLKYLFLNRGLRIAGQVTVCINGKNEHRLFDSIKPVAVIPGPATVYNQKEDSTADFKDSYCYATTGKTSIKTIIAQTIKCEESQIIGYDLFVSDAQKPSVINSQLLTGAHIANHISCLSALLGFIEASKSDEKSGSTRVCAIFDQGEHDSQAVTGSNSTMLEDLLEYIFDSKLDEVKARSLHLCCLSADANHPINQKVANDDLPVIMSKGVVIKRSMRSDIPTDDVSQYVVKSCAEKIGIPTQIYQCRNMVTNTPSFGTNVTTNQGIRTVDIGIPVFSLRNVRETVAVNDVLDYRKLVSELLSNFSDYYIEF